MLEFEGPFIVLPATQQEARQALANSQPFLDAKVNTYGGRPQETIVETDEMLCRKQEVGLEQLPSDLQVLLKNPEFYLSKPNQDCLKKLAEFSVKYEDLDWFELHGCNSCSSFDLSKLMSFFRYKTKKKTTTYEAVAASRIFDPPEDAHTYYFITGDINTQFSANGMTHTHINTTKGLVVAYIKADCEKKECYINQVEVDQRYRRRGICVAILTRFVKSTKNRVYKLNNAGGDSAHRCYSKVFIDEGYDYMRKDSVSNLWTATKKKPKREDTPVRREAATTFKSSSTFRNARGRGK